MTKLGDLLINPKTTLAWIMGALGAPTAFTAWLVPIRESGSLIPQLAIGAWVRRAPHRKGFWVVGSLAQGLCVGAIALVTLNLQGLEAGLAIIGLLILFSIARGFCSVAVKDVQGKCIPKGRRGRLSGLATTLAGAATIVVTILLFWGDHQPHVGFYALILGIAAALWIIAALVFMQVKEHAGETGGAGNGLREAWKSLTLLRSDTRFRQFVVTRALLLCSALTAPFFVTLAQRHNHSGWLLAGFLLANSIASTVSAGIWGWMADASSRQVLIRAAGLASALALAVGLLSLFGGPGVASPWFYPGAFFVLAIAHAGVRLGRGNLPGRHGREKRTDYVAVSNSSLACCFWWRGYQRPGIADLAGSGHSATRRHGCAGSDQCPASAGSGVIQAAGRPQQGDAKARGALGRSPEYTERGR